MKAIIKREFNAYFRSPLGYLFIAVYLFFSAMYFNGVLLSGNSQNFTQVYEGMFTILLLLLPVITMGIFSEDKKMKTDQLILTSPVNIYALVLGKFLSIFCIYAMCVSVTVIYAWVLDMYTAISWSLIWGNVFGALIFGAAFISIGCLISSLTESMFISFVGTFVVSATLLLMDIIPTNLSGWMGKAVNFLVTWVSFVQRYTPFINGLFDFSSIIFFLSVIATFLFLTVRAIEKRRWS